ncbi:MAG TPA: tyrosinase family protein [Terriglobales bacterium]|nr:tyrosinase family protein [Terriglobales bacterium]
MKKSSRRSFLVETGKAASATVLGSVLFNAKLALGATTYVRRNLAGMDASDPVLLSYRKAIAAMQALAQSNPLSWTYQGAIHWTTLTPLLTSWDNCEHGTEFFWSWHRMYLYWFERIVRKMCGDECWALPYWNWAPGSDLHLPAPFRDPASELYTVNRNAAMNSGAGALNAALVSVGNSTTGSFGLTDFFSTNLNIQGPHGSVHTGTGGWMASVPTAAQDPVFYVHHSNVDRLWDLWLAQGGGRSDPVLNSAWTSKTYTFFDEAGAAVNMNACEILRAAQQLNYVYEGEPPQVLSFCRRRPPFPWWEFVNETLFVLPGPPVELGGEAVTVPIELKELVGKIRPVLESKKDTLLLDLDGVEADEPPGVGWAVYAGLPAGTEAGVDSPYYLGSLSLFGVGIRSEKHHEFKPAHFVYALKRAVEAAMKANQERLPLTFVPLGIVVDGRATRPEVKAKVRIGKISLVVQRATEERGEA